MGRKRCIKSYPGSGAVEGPLICSVGLVVTLDGHDREGEITYLVIVTSASNFARPSIALGVIKINWRPTELRAALHYKQIISKLGLGQYRRSARLTSMSVLIARLTLSMNTSNSSRQRIGDPMASQMARSKQMEENDFSPPESVLVFRAAASFRVASGSI